MTFDEPEVTETAMAAAFRAAGFDVDALGFAAMILAYEDDPIGLLKRFATEKKKWLAVHRALVRYAKSKHKASPIPTKPARKLIAENEPRAAKKFAQLQEKIVTAFLMRDGRNIEDVLLDEAQRLITESTLEAAILRKVLAYARPTPGVTIGNAVPDELLKRFIREARAELRKEPA
jgi:hypothetical protein